MAYDYADYVVGLIVGMAISVALILSGNQSVGTLYFLMNLAGLTLFIGRSKIVGVRERTSLLSTELSAFGTAENLMFSVFGVVLCYLFMAAVGMATNTQSFGWGMDRYMCAGWVGEVAGIGLSLDFTMSLILLAQIAVGFGESSIFHIELQEFMEKKFSSSAGVLLSAVILNVMFMLEHSWRYGFDKSIFTFAGGMALSMTYIIFRSPLATCLAHALFNMSQIILLMPTQSFVVVGSYAVLSVALLMPNIYISIRRRRFGSGIGHSEKTV